MTQAYIDGFRKTAEALGVDPDALAKEAGIGKMVGNGVSFVKRLGQLFNGGNRGMLDNLRTQNKSYTDTIKQLKAFRADNSSHIRNELAKVWATRAGALGLTGAGSVAGYKAYENANRSAAE